ncbi:MAG: TIGR01459 family HAD-type hydrolase [Alphaproteobacteria bacterium]
MSPPRLITGLSELTGKYDAFIFDLWGVIHDGKTCYPGVAPSFHALREAGKKIGIISNSPRPAASAADNIRKFGLTPDMYDVIMTSGQLTYEALRDRPDPWLQALGRRCVHFGPPHEFALYAPLGLREAATPQDADFILATGVEDVHKTLADYDSILKAALEKKLPLLCANPDLGVSQEGRHKLAAGSIAHHYADMGGDARVPYGKPHPAIFPSDSGAAGRRAGPRRDDRRQSADRYRGSAWRRHGDSMDSRRRAQAGTRRGHRHREPARLSCQT